MGEPLKDKIIDFDMGFNGFREEDIKSAVECLKEELEITNRSGAEFRYNDIISSIDQAFPDLQPK